MRIGLRPFLAIPVAAACAAVVACGGSDSGSTAPTGTAAAPATSTAASASKVDQATVDFGLKYTGGKAGKADPSLPPAVVGLVYQNGATPSFPEMGAAADAAVEYINENLGGIDGHPVKLETCTMVSEEDGQKCGAQLVDAKVPVASMGLAVIGNASLYKTINKKFPVLVGSTSTAPDNTSPSVYNLSGGGGAVIFAMAKDTSTIGSKSTALVSVGNVGGKYTMEQIAVPALDQLGVTHGKTVYYPDDATTPDIASALQAAGASSADSVFFDPSGPQQCVSLWDSLKQLSLDKPVIGTPICNADSFVDHTGVGPEGWRIWGFGTNPRVVDDPEAKVFNNVMDAYGQGKWKYVGFAPQEFRDILTIALFGNKLGFDNLTAAGYDQQIRAFRGPAFMVPGPMHCDAPPDKNTPTICGNQAIGSEFKDGKWVTLPAVTNELKPAS